MNKSEFNLLNPKECKNRRNQTNWLINCAAYTNVDKAEEEVHKANFINGYAIQGLSETLKEIDCNLIQVLIMFWWRS